MFSWGDIAQVVVSAAFFGSIFQAFLRRGHRKPVGIKDSPKDWPYRRYTTTHDLTLRARDVPNALASDTYLVAKGWILRDLAIWQRKAEVARTLERSLPVSLNADIASLFDGGSAADWAICLLIDHSGSMRDEPIARTASAVRRVSNGLVAAGAQVAVLGFSTVGWHGGKARQDWLWNGRPKRPGRLCALLHIEY